MRCDAHAADRPTHQAARPYGDSSATSAPPSSPEPAPLADSGPVPMATHAAKPCRHRGRCRPWRTVSVPAAQSTSVHMRPSASLCRRPAPTVPRGEQPIQVCHKIIAFSLRKMSARIISAQSETRVSARGCAMARPRCLGSADALPGSSAVGYRLEGRSSPDNPNEASAHAGVSVRSLNA
jgi:hypothetical protein